MAKREKTEKTSSLNKMSKKDLLEIMLRQGEEIDRLRVENAELKEQLHRNLSVIRKAAAVYLESKRARHE